MDILSEYGHINILLGYNPGRLAQIEIPTFLLSAKLYQLERLTFLNALDEENDLQKRKFGGVPGLVAGTFKIGFQPIGNEYYPQIEKG